MNQLRKFIERSSYGKRSGPVAYVLRSTALSQAAEGMEWHAVESFSAADEVLSNPALKEVFKAAIEKGCAIVTPKANGAA